ncbi:MAG TPA: exonuclease domain-containing protein [Thermoleophilia bacterium]|nr:exonuclease domain-containing protein [Thermoleophilia bacterium]
MQLAFTTVDELVALLEQAGEPLDYREVWPRLFPVANCPPELMRTLVSDIVRDDERLSWDGPFHVGLEQWRARRRDLADVAFTVVDLETTGGTPGFTKITEIGAVRLEGGCQVATFSQLVDPRQPVPAKITDITGISAAMLVGQPPIEEVLPRFLEFSADSVLVAHNARFDLGFLDYELSVLMRRTFPRPTLDTLRLARRVLSPMRCSLAALAERFDTEVKPRHRALDDALATAEILLILLARAQEQGVATLEEVVRLCEPGARRNYHKIVLTEGLPTRPGVYIMRDARGHELYIGKAENLRRRARDHFLQRQAYGARQALELLDRFDVLETGSEFAALLLEARLIGKHRPPYNQHGTRVSSYHYVKLTTDPYPRLYATPNRRDDGALYAGPFRRASFARRLVDLLNAIYPLRTCVRLLDKADETRACLRHDIGACLAPCRGLLNGEYGDIVAQVSRVLEGDGRELDRELDRRQAELVAELAFEQAARLQSWRETLEQALRTIGRLRGACHTWALLLYPARQPGRVTVYSVAGGSIVDERALRPDELTPELARDIVAAIYAADPPAPPLPVDTIDEILLVSSWLRHHRQAVNVVALPAPDAPAALREAAVGELARRLPMCAGTTSQTSSDAVPGQASLPIDAPAGR